MSSSFRFMQLALKKASVALDYQEVPVGAVIVYNEQVIASSHNQCLMDMDPTAHAEIVALRHAARFLDSIQLNDCDMYVTLEPCAMCAQALAHARIRALFFGAYDPKGGGVEHGARVFGQNTCHHRPQVIGGIYEKECGALLRNFFHSRRA